MFTSAERADIAKRVAAALEADPRIERVEGFGSIVDGNADRHSDVDLAAVVLAEHDPAAVASDWFERTRELLPVVHGFHEQVGPAEVCGFLLENHLEVDLGFGHAGVVAAVLAHEKPDHHRVARGYLDFAWHDVLHAAIAIDRQRPLRAVFYINRIRDRTIELACLRLGLDERHHKAADELPAEIRIHLERTVPASLIAGDLFAALRSVTTALYDETRAVDVSVTDRLEGSVLAYIDELESS